MLNSRGRIWNNSRKLGAEIYMQQMQKCTILDTISEGSKKVITNEVQLKEATKTDLEVAYNLQQAQAEMENSMFINFYQSAKIHHEVQKSKNEESSKIEPKQKSISYKYGLSICQAQSSKVSNGVHSHLLHSFTLHKFCF